MEEVEVVRRLALVRYLYEMAVEQSRLPEPLSSMSLLWFHDAAELFLGTAADHQNLRKKSIAFMDYWGEFRERGVSLPEEAAMSRLNEARVSLKHKGLLPAALQLEAFRASATSFLRDATALVFDTEFDRISMGSVVRDVETRRNLERAEELADAGELEAAASELAVAFRRILVGYREILQTRFGQGHPTFDTSQITPKSIASDPGLALRLVSLGLEYDQVMQFHTLVPLVHYAYGSGEWRFVVDSGARQRRGRAFTPEDYRFCRDFVVDAAIKIERSTIPLTCGSSDDEE